MNLYGALDGFKDRALDLTIAGVSATGAVIAFDYLAGMVGELGHPAVKPALQVVAGVAAAEFLEKYDSRVANGAGIALVSTGLVRLTRIFMPGLIPEGAAVGAFDDDTVFLGGSPLGRFLNGAPVSVEDANPLAGAPVSVEESSMGGWLT